MSYISLSDQDKKEMLARIGAASIQELFQSIPENVRMKELLKIPGPMSEPELMHSIGVMAAKNTTSAYLSFLGAGAYPHLIPSVVDYLSMRGEFISPYTPYQPEVSQGTLQVIFEFQTLICQLTGMDIANASLYDGASGTAEAVLMAHRLKRQPRILLARSLHPQYREVVTTYSRNLGLTIEEVGYTKTGELDLDDLEDKLDEKVSVFVAQSPNFFGIIEDLRPAFSLVRQHQALSVAVIAEPVSLGILEAPGHLGADIATGEGQSLGLPLSFGGPYLGFMACCRDYVRQFPGRIAGETKDVEGRRGYVLTLSTREQHIRRERATSNICTNQAWCALRAAIFLQVLGKEGLREMAWQNIQKARYALDRLKGLKGVRARFSGRTFNEFVLVFEKPLESVQLSLRRNNILGGIALEKDYPELAGCALFCVTETHSKEDIDRLAQAVTEAAA